MFVELDVAQSAYEAMPAYLRLMTLSPMYCAADAMRDRSITPRYLLFRTGDAAMVHSVHESPIPGGGVDWQSPYGYGGPVVVGMSPEDIRRAWMEYGTIAERCGVVAEFLRFHPLARNHEFYPGTVVADRAVVSVDLSPRDLESTYTGRARNTLKKARKANVEVTSGTSTDSVNEFIALYRDAMQAVGASKFYVFPPDYFTALFRLPGVQLLVARQGGVPISSAVFLFGSEAAEYHLSGTNAEGRIAGATNLILHEAARLAQAAGLKRLYLGGGTDHRPDNPLLRFKQSFGGAELTFRFGSKILNQTVYESLRARFPEAADSSNRVLFYRS